MFLSYIKFLYKKRAGCLWGILLRLIEWSSIRLDTMGASLLDWVGPWRPGVVALDRLVDLLPVDRNLLRGFNAQTDLVTPNVYNRDHDLVSDHDRFVALPGQNQHRTLLLNEEPAALLNKQPCFIQKLKSHHYYIRYMLFVNPREQGPRRFSF